MKNIRAENVNKIKIIFRKAKKNQNLIKKLSFKKIKF